VIDECTSSSGPAFFGVYSAGDPAGATVLGPQGPGAGPETVPFFGYVAILGGFAMAALFVNGRSERP
jgi:hypothetical protein